MTTAISAFGTYLKVGDGGSPETFTTIAEVKDITGPDFTLDTVEVTNQDSGHWKEFIPTLLAAGEVRFSVNFVPTDATQGYSTGLLKDMVNRTKRNFKLVFPDASSTTWSFSAYVTAFSPKAAVRDVLAADITLKITGQPTLA
ncbi:MAG: phage tail tube protein [Candidatus Hadarchaeum sp.]